MMDGVALASVITSGAVGMTSAVVSWFNVKRTASSADAARVQTRRAESYLEILRLVEAETRWTAQQAREYENRVEQEEVGEPWMHLPEPARVAEPTAADKAMISAHLAAFGSKIVCALYEDWRGTVDRIERYMPEQDYYMSFYEDRPIPRSEITNLVDFLVPKMMSAQAALADGIAKELGHR